MKLPTFDEFKQAALAEGFDEVLERDWAAGQHVASHSHPFGVKALVVRGDLVLTVGEAVTHLQAGDPFTLARDTLFSSIYAVATTTQFPAG